MWPFGDISDQNQQWHISESLFLARFLFMSFPYCFSYRKFKVILKIEMCESSRSVIFKGCFEYFEMLWGSIKISDKKKTKMLIFKKITQQMEWQSTSLYKNTIESSAAEENHSAMLFFLSIYLIFEDFYPQDSLATMTSRYSNCSVSNQLNHPIFFQVSI